MSPTDLLLKCQRSSDCKLTSHIKIIPFEISKSLSLILTKSHMFQILFELFFKQFKKVSNQRHKYLRYQRCEGWNNIFLDSS